VVREQVLIDGYESSELGRTHMDRRRSHLAFSWFTSGGPCRTGQAVRSDSAEHRRLWTRAHRLAMMPMP
jgi:hypothetical protein